MASFDHEITTFPLQMKKKEIKILKCFGISLNLDRLSVNNRIYLPGIFGTFGITCKVLDYVFTIQIKQSIQLFFATIKLLSDLFHNQRLTTESSVVDCSTYVRTNNNLLIIRHCDDF